MTSKNRSDDNSLPVNPYAASEIEKPRAMATGAGGEQVVRRYRARLDWADRRLFLKSVGFTRLTTLTMVGMTSQNLLTTLNTWWGFLVRNSIQSFLEFASLTLALFGIATAILSLYTYWLNWKYADALQAVAGGATASASEWSSLHFRIEWLTAAVVLMTLCSSVCMWFLATRY